MISVPEIKQVKITGLTLLRIMKHSRESQDKIISGQLQGIINQDDQTVEITYSYPWPAKDENHPELFDTYIAELTKKIDDTQIDSFQIGWYLFSQKNDYLFYDNFSAHYEFQKKIPFALFLVYDLQAKQRGQTVPFKLLKIQSKVMEILKKCELENGLISKENIQSLDLNQDQIYEEVEFEIQNSPLVEAFLFEYQNELFNSDQHQPIEVQKLLETNIEQLIESLNELDDQHLNLNKVNLQGKQKAEFQQYEADNFMDVLVNIKRVQQFIDVNQSISQMMFDGEAMLNKLADESF